MSSKPSSFPVSGTTVLSYKGHLRWQKVWFLSVWHYYFFGVCKSRHNELPKTAKFFTLLALKENTRENKRILGIWRPQNLFAGKDRCYVFVCDTWLRTFVFWNSDCALRGKKCQLQTSCRWGAMPRTETAPWNKFITFFFRILP